jgi:hypothetical protein
MTVLIPLKRKHTRAGARQGKSIKNMKAGNSGTRIKGRRKAKNPVDWSAHTGLGKRQ